MFVPRLQTCEFEALYLLLSTYGHAVIETSKIPIIIALLTLNIIRYAVTMPPHIRPIHSWSSELVVVLLFSQSQLTVGEVIL